MGWVAPIKNDGLLEDFKKALEQVDEKYYIMLELGLGTAMNLKDILDLKIGDIRNKREIISYIGKKKTKTVFKIDDDLYNYINDFVKKNKLNDDNYVFEGRNHMRISREQVYRIFKAVGDEIGLPTIGAQTMRKTFAYRYYRDTKDITYLQSLFNHASANVTYRYIGVKPDIQVILEKESAKENQAARYALYLDDSGRKRLTAAIDILTDIRAEFDNPMNNDAFYGTVDSFLNELDKLIESYKYSQKSAYERNKLEEV